MAKITLTQSSALKRLMQTDAWDVVDQALANRVNKLRGEPVSGQNEFETLRMLHVHQGKVDGLIEFFDDLEKLVFDD